MLETLEVVRKILFTSMKLPDEVIEGYKKQIQLNKYIDYGTVKHGNTYQRVKIVYYWNILGYVAHYPYHPEVAKLLERI